jgi:hypothetical protein
MIGYQPLLRPVSGRHPGRFSASFFEESRYVHSQASPRTICQDSSGPVDVLSTEDLLVGTILALMLAFTASFLQSRSSQNDFVLWEKEGMGNVTDTTESNDDNLVFDAESWKEMSRPDNYVLYNRKLSERERIKKEGQAFRVERPWVVIALLALFVPIFSFEFFFALSRQVVCGGNPMDQGDWAEFLCSPALLDSTS